MPLGPRGHTTPLDLTASVLRLSSTYRRMMQQPGRTLSTHAIKQQPASYPPAGVERRYLRSVWRRRQHLPEAGVSRPVLLTSSFTRRVTAAAVQSSTLTSSVHSFISQLTLELSRFNLASLWAFLLKHPLVTLAVATVVLFSLPRMVRATTRLIVAPLAILLALYLAATNPAAFVNCINFVTEIVEAHPEAASCVILAVTLLILVPYIFAVAAGATLILLLLWASQLGVTPQLHLQNGQVSGHHQKHKVSSHVGMTSIQKGESSWVNTARSIEGGRIHSQQTPRINDIMENS